MNNVVDSIAAKFAAKKANLRPHAQLLRHELVTPEIAKVVVTLSHDSSLQENRAALASLFQGKATPIANSFREINVHNQQGKRIALVGFVGANVLAQELTPEVQASYKEVAKNVLMDEHDHTMWQVAEVGGRKYIRRQHHEDLSELMKETASYVNTISRQYTELSSLMIDCDGQFNVVAFVDPEHQNMRYGYVCEHASYQNGYNHAVVCNDSTDMVYVDQRLVVQCAYNVDPNSQLHQFVKDHQEQTAGLPDAGTMKNYYAKVYGYDPQYLKELFGEIEDQAKA